MGKSFEKSGGFSLFYSKWKGWKHVDVIISTHEKTVYHQPWCLYVDRITEGYRKQIPEEKAKRKGYCACKFCSSVRGIVYKYRNPDKCGGTPKKWCSICYDSVDDAFCVRTSVGFWKLIWRENCQEWHVFHMNHRGWKGFDDSLPSRDLMRGSFHRQNDYKASPDISRILHYIEGHDKNYEMSERNIKQMPHHTKKQRDHYRHHKNRKKKESIKQVYKLLDTIKKGKRP